MTKFEWRMANEKAGDSVSYIRHSEFEFRHFPPTVAFPSSLCHIARWGKSSPFLP
jgi:hypothetical protein